MNTFILIIALCGIVILPQIIVASRKSGLRAARGIRRMFLEPRAVAAHTRYCAIEAIKQFPEGNTVGILSCFIQTASNNNNFITELWSRLRKSNNEETEFEKVFLGRPQSFSKFKAAYPELFEGVEVGNVNYDQEIPTTNVCDWYFACTLLVSGDFDDSIFFGTVRVPTSTENLTLSNPILSSKIVQFRPSDSDPPKPPPNPLGIGFEPRQVISILSQCKEQFLKVYESCQLEQILSLEIVVDPISFATASMFTSFEGKFFNLKTELGAFQAIAEPTLGSLDRYFRPEPVKFDPSLKLIRCSLEYFDGFTRKTGDTLLLSNLHRKWPAVS